MNPIGQYLTDADLAAMFVGLYGVAPGEDVLDIEPRVERWLAGSLPHRSAFKVAVEVSKLARPEPASDPAENARQLDLQEGIGDVNGMSLAEYAEARPQLLRRSAGDGVGIFGSIGN